MRRQHMVYMAKNVKTRDLYIGYTSTSLTKRRKRHVTAATCGKHQCPKFHPVTNGFDKKGRSAAGPMKNARPVICVDDGMKFQSASAAAAHYDVAKSAVIELCLGKNGRKSVGGLRFAYKE